MNSRTLLVRLLIGLMAFGAPACIAWAVTHGTDAPTSTAVARTPRPVPPVAPRIAETTVSSERPGGTDTTTTSSVPTTDEAGGDEAGEGGDALVAAPLFPLAETVRTTPAADSFREIPSTPLIGDDVTPDGTTTETSTSTATTGSEPAGDGTSLPSGAMAAVRFIDPCADQPSACAELVGRGAIGGTIETVDTPGVPVEIRGVSVSGATSKGCSVLEVPEGRRAVQVDLDRPAGLELSWSRAGAPVGETSSRPLRATDVEDFADNPSRGWSVCLDVPFPTTTDSATALLTVVATADDGSTDRLDQPVFDDDSRRLLIAVVDDDEVVAMTPNIGEVTLAGIELRDAENEVGGCRRAASQVLTDRPAPGTPTDAMRGTEVPADLAGRILPAGGRWVAARFDGLEESQRHAICLFSIGRARGDGDGAIEATDAVLVQPPDRERYRLRPVEFNGPGSVDGRRVSILIPGLCSGWGLVADTATSTEQRLDDSEWCETGARPVAETAFAQVEVEGLPTSEATLVLPARCVGTATCDPVGVTTLLRLDVAGPRYTRRLCGTGTGGCEGGLRPRDEVIGSVLLAVERLGDPVGSEGWTIGGTRRFSAEIPADHWSLIDYRATELELGADGALVARVKTVVPTDVTVDVQHCSTGLLGSASSTSPATDHVIPIAEPLGAGGCALMYVTAIDPTGERTEPLAESLGSVRRDPASGTVSVEMEIVALPRGTFPIRGGFQVKVGPGLPGSRGVWSCASGPGSVATVDGSSGRSQLVERTRVALDVDWLGGCSDATAPLPDDVVVEADVDLDELRAGPVVVDHVQPDGVHLRFRVTATDIRMPR